MSSTISRSRAAALKDTGPEAAELQSQLQTLEKDSLAGEQSERIENVHARLEAGHRIRQSLLESQGTFHIKDTFRHLNGFQAVIATLDGVARKYEEFGCTIDEELTIIKSLIQAIFGVLTAALQSHKGNQKYFRQHVEGGGWMAVENSLSTMLTGGKGNADTSLRALTDKVFGCLLACAQEDESMTDFFSTLKRHTAATDSRPKSSSSSVRADPSPPPAPEPEQGSEDPPHDQLP